jgi:tRNA (guanine37-N1)-methyltransferase
MIKIDILTLFPEMFKGVFSESIIKRAREKKLVEIKTHNLRDWAKDKRGTVDDRPYGGGIGMILRVDIIDKALEALRNQETKKLRNLPAGRQGLKPKIILLTPKGRVFTQARARELSKEKHLLFVCGHYEGVDERVRKHLVDEEISIGDYVLTGGEIPAMVVTDAIVRLIPGVLEKIEAVKDESFQSPHLTPHHSALLEYPQYTRPEVYKGWEVPEVLLSGNHEKIAQWRKEKSLERTKKRRPDLFQA